MSEQKNNTEGMNFGTGSTLEELFGATIPQVDLGVSFPHRRRQSSHRQCP